MLSVYLQASKFLLSTYYMILVFFGHKTFRLYKYDIWWDYVITIIECLKNLRNHKELHRNINQVVTKEQIYL